jgi:hypothetical protein
VADRNGARGLPEPAATPISSGYATNTPDLTEPPVRPPYASQAAFIGL